jgi:hypothetical protein
MEIVLTLHFTLGNTLELLVNYELLHFHTFYQEEFEDTKEIIRIGSGTAYPSGAPEFTPGFSGVPVTRSLVLYFVDCCLSFLSFW